MKTEDPRPILIPPGSGSVLRSLGVTHKLTSAQTGGACYLFESVFGPMSGNKLHVHSREDEVVWVLEGALEIRLGEATLRAEAGAGAHLPRQIPHALYNPLKVPLRLLAMAIPGGLEHFFDELEAAMQNGDVDDAMRREISLKYGLEWLE